MCINYHHWCSFRIQTFQCSHLVLWIYLNSHNPLHLDTTHLKVINKSNSVYNRDLQLVTTGCANFVFLFVFVSNIFTSIIHVRFTQ